MVGHNVTPLIKILQCVSLTSEIYDPGVWTHQSAEHILRNEAYNNAKFILNQCSHITDKTQPVSWRATAGRCVYSVISCPFVTALPCEVVPHNISEQTSARQSQLKRWRFRRRKFMWHIGLIKSREI